MLLNKVDAGHYLPEEFNVIIEIPAHSDPVKYEIDKETGALFVDRFMNAAMHYPCNYGYIPNTLCEDGDPMDVLVVAPLPVISGCVVRARPLGVLKMTDESGGDAKILAVPIKKECTQFDDINSYEQMSKTLLARIAHFFQHYKDLDSGKWVKIDGWDGPEEAKAEVLRSVERYKDSHK
ncbi:MAG TPA: inorganic diphosphatase [Candidatus Competibacteraceae bacterium]|nr:inorganic diphosphatase [Candidatus Competibacteraceae bacterium]HRZ06072.1 inorganic diphosphatase [Candidatus Competibacteraceae bacterium]